ncbi:helix-turn-helix domain-containing protein [Bradyrhizobium sp. WYCCWR 13023]|uniref:Helix-turn-helix domain-containing protein n=1 Tax=Bradyrhizobium zhengyangense TaxID=2911009 RepID=A0A9X1R5Q9_9BRAD|nr:MULTISPECIES: helix-turn-helix domain-containing protein [Bradyrhizobium]MCG2626316.1 helix-turn-helix domain-containing protein [Bradyrhizobium zhengyangense]MCG2668322.1 helix-turn-helix domain-containing protein [Bradyrhizobium zhengyangense]
MSTILYNYICTICPSSMAVVQNRQINGAAPKVRAVEIRQRMWMSLASKIKELRVKKKKSLQDVADEVGASKAHIWDLETGKSSNPSIELLTKLAKCFGVSVAEMIGENPAAKDVDPQVVAMYRELKELSPADRQAIQVMMDHLKTRKPKG